MKASILIVDHSHSWGADLRDRLIPANVRVHVVSSPKAALALARTKKIAVAIVEYDSEAWATGLFTEFRRLGIRTIYSGPTPQVIEEALNGTSHEVAGFRKMASL